MIENNPKRRMITFDTVKTISISKQNNEEASSIYAFKQYDSARNEGYAKANFEYNSDEENYVTDDYLSRQNGDFNSEAGFCLNENLYRENDNVAKTDCRKNAPFSFSFVYSKGEVILRKQIKIPLTKSILVATAVVVSVVLLPKALMLIKLKR